MNVNVILDEELTPIILPIKLYEFFMANGKQGMEAKTLWEHLVYTARKQSTNQVWANNTYIQNGTGYGERKVKELKSWLKKHGLISYIQDKDPKTGKILKTYIRVKGCSQSTGAVSARVDNRTCGFDGQMLKTNNEILKNKNESKGETTEKPIEQIRTYVETDQQEFDSICLEISDSGKIKNDRFKITNDDRHILKAFYKEYGVKVKEVCNQYLADRRSPAGDLKNLFENDSKWFHGILSKLKDEPDPEPDQKPKENEQVIAEQLRTEIIKESDSYVDPKKPVTEISEEMKQDFKTRYAGEIEKISDPERKRELYKDLEDVIKNLGISADEIVRIAKEGGFMPKEIGKPALRIA